MIADARQAQRFIICHSTLPYGDYPHAAPAVCRGFSTDTRPQPCTSLACYSGSPKSTHPRASRVPPPQRRPDPQIRPCRRSRTPSIHTGREITTCPRRPSRPPPSTSPSRPSTCHTFDQPQRSWLLTFTARDAGIAVAAEPLSDIVAAPIALFGTAMQMMDSRPAPAGQFRDVIGYGLMDRATGITVVVDRHGQHASSYTRTPIGEQHLDATVGLLSMISAGPGFHNDTQPPKPRTRAPPAASTLRPARSGRASAACSPPTGPSPPTCTTAGSPAPASPAAAPPSPPSAAPRSRPASRSSPNLSPPTRPTTSGPCRPGPGRLQRHAAGRHAATERAAGRLGRGRAGHRRDRDDRRPERHHRDRRRYRRLLPIRCTARTHWSAVAADACDRLTRP